MNPENLGYTEWFQLKNDPDLLNFTSPARIISVSRDQYIIKNQTGETPAELTGKLLFNAQTALDYPAVGDWVYAQYFDSDTFAVIHQIFPRKTVLKRKTAGRSVDFQLIAANIDVAIIMQSLDANYNPARLERYLVMANEASIKPVIFLSKKDLISSEKLHQITEEIRQRTGQQTIFTFSNMTGDGISEVKQHFNSGLTYCLLGSSGVGKSTLLNILLGEEILKTQSVRESDSRGKHTTTMRQMLFLDNGAMIIDTPGMRELGNFDIDTGLAETFSEINEMALQCKYSNCTHEHEKGCAVLKAVEEGIISKERYRNYIKMKKEANYYEMSYLEKRQKDKNFGKMVKNVMKNKRDKL